MARTKDKLYGTADTVRPYVDRALHDDDLHDNLKEAFKAAREVYAELLGNRNLTATAVRAATDKDIQDNLRTALEELREASDRIQGKEDHGKRNTMLLLAGITAGILLNPKTGPQTREWLMNKVTGAGSDDYTYTPPSTAPTSAPSAATAPTPASSAASASAPSGGKGEASGGKGEQSGGKGDAGDSGSG